MPPPLRAAAEFDISYRLKSEKDLPFIERLYRSTREEELAMSGWPEALKQQFVAHQLLMQTRHFEHAYPRAEWLLIERGGEAIGRLYVDDSEGGILLVDIALLPESRGRGIGTAIVRDLLEQGRQAGRAVRLSVFRTNKARRLYERVGFKPAGSAGAYDEMEWRDAEA